MGCHHHLPDVEKEMISPDEIFHELRELIAAADDPKDRAMLLIMQRVLARVEEMMNDTTKMKTNVLNGHEPNHHEDHDWVQGMRKRNCHEMCDWVVTFKKEQEQSALDKKSLLMKFLEAIVSHVGTAVAVGLIAYFAFK
jgi:hypothetical protein